MSHFTPINDSNCPCGNPGFKRYKGDPFNEDIEYICDRCWYETERGESPPPPRHYSCCSSESDDEMEVDLIFWQGEEEEEEVLL